jgi:hypothetical protein
MKIVMIYTKLIMKKITDIFLGKRLLWLYIIVSVTEGLFEQYGTLCCKDHGFVDVV